MEGVISYRPRMGKAKLKELVVKKLHYDNINQFIDHAVGQTLEVELNVTGDPKTRKMVAEVAEVIYKYAPLKFVKPTKRESDEIRAKAERVLSGKVKGIPIEQILKKHGAR
jgi:hypothetical protein